MKFQRKGHTDKETKRTSSGDEIMGNIIRNDMGFVPISISPHGHPAGSLFERFMYGTAAIPISNFTDGRPNAEAASRVARSNKVPSGVLLRANEIWRRENPGSFYGTSYKAMDPMKYFQQQLGLIISKALSSHLIRAHNKNKSRRPLECKCDGICDTTVNSSSSQSGGASVGCGASCNRTSASAGSSS